MKSAHDPNLTSWALNELSPAERAAFEESLKKNPDLLAEAETTQNFCRFVQNHLRDEKAALTDAQRARLKAAASINTQQARDHQASAGKVIKPKPRQWWQNPSIVLPLSAAAAIAIGFVPYLSRNHAPSQVNESAAPVIVATATPKPEPMRSVLSPAPLNEPASVTVSQQLAALQPVKQAAAVEEKSTGTGMLTLGDNRSETGVHLTTGVRTLSKIGSGSAGMLTGVSTYTGGLAMNGALLQVGFSNAPASSGYFGEPTMTRATVTARVGRLNRTTSGSISELGDLSDISEKANIIVNGGVPPRPAFRTVAPVER